MADTSPRLQTTVPLPMRAGKVAMSPGEDGLIGIPFPEHSSELLSRLNDQRRAGLLCDLTLTSRGTRYPTHRSVMAAVSLYFRQLFGAEGGAGEAGEAGAGGGAGGFSVCQLDCVAPDALDALLEFAYTATLTIRSSGMRDVLRGAQLLGIQCVADACRDILGEPVEVPVEARAQHTERSEEPGREVGGGGGREVGEVGVVRGEKGSRRKTDRKKVKRLGLSAHHQPLSQPHHHPHHPHHPHHVAVNPSPSPPVSHPSPAHDGIHSHPSTQPPSPEQEEHHPKTGQNGGARGIRHPERGATVNGGPHWPQGRPLIAHQPPVPPSDDKFSEEEMEILGKDGLVAGATSITTPVTERGEVLPGVGGGRKRKSQTPQQCPVCQKIIHGAGKLPRHMRTHTGEKPFQCTTCGVRFTRNDKLKIHMRKHTGERPYPCPHCPARFLHSYDLKNHLSLHSGARPYECPLCHKAFAREDHLQRHRKGHSCLELRTRRPRRGLGHGEEGRGDGGGGRDSSSPLEPLALQAHPSAFLPRGMLIPGDGPVSGPPLMFQGEAERKRSLALQALAHLGAQRLPGYPGLLLRDLELQAAREAAGEEPGGGRSPPVIAQHNSWVDDEEEEEEEMGDEDEDGE